MSKLMLTIVLALGVAGCGKSRSEERNVPGPAGSLHVDDGGKQTKQLPVVFVPGFAGDTSQWEAQLAHLRPTRRAVALDLRAHGQSEAPNDGKHSMDALADDIGAAVDYLEIDRFVLVGHSMGGAAALVYAGKHPERVAGLVLVGTPGKTPPDAAKQIMAQLDSDAYDQTMGDYWKKLETNATETTRAKVEEGRERMSRDRSLSFIQATFDYDPLPALRRYDGPILAITADGDDQPGALHTLAPIPRKTIAGTSHWVMLDKPQELNAMLDAFLADGLPVVSLSGR